MRRNRYTNNNDAFDERGLLKNQHRYRVRLPFMDHDPTRRPRIVDSATTVSRCALIARR
jgi:hypothetical protein